MSDTPSPEGFGPPEGFAPHFRKSPFTAPWEPIYSKVEAEQVRLGVWLREVHCNSRGLVHGGFVSSMADNAMGLSCVTALEAAGREAGSLVTISLHVDFAGMAKLGAWFETDSDVVKLTRALGFVGCLVSADGTVVARGTATFKLG
jgi:uncharacterized protein (TIGR00369 family)